LVTLLPTNIIQEQMETSVDVGRTFAIDIDKTEVDLQKTILMIE
jgi:hypothetical protein